MIRQYYLALMWINVALATFNAAWWINTGNIQAGLLLLLAAVIAIFCYEMQKTTGSN